MLAPQTLIPVTSALEDRRNRDFGREPADKGQVASDGGHRELTSTRAVPAIERFLKVKGTDVSEATSVTQEALVTLREDA